LVCLTRIFSSCYLLIKLISGTPNKPEGEEEIVRGKREREKRKKISSRKRERGRKREMIIQRKRNLM